MVSVSMKAVAYASANTAAPMTAICAVLPIPLYFMTHAYFCFYHAPQHHVGQRMVEAEVGVRHEVQRDGHLQIDMIEHIIPASSHHHKGPAEASGHSMYQGRAAHAAIARMHTGSAPARARGRWAARSYLPGGTLFSRQEGKVYSAPSRS